MSDTDRLWVKTKHLLLAILPAIHFTDKQTLIGRIPEHILTEHFQYFISVDEALATYNIGVVVAVSNY